MSKTFRPDWQEERGPRYGNKRKQVARVKVKDRRAQKRTERQAAINAAWSAE